MSIKEVHIRRPPNPWIIWAKDYRKKYREKYKNSIKKKNYILLSVNNDNSFLEKTLGTDWYIKIDKILPNDITSILLGYIWTNIISDSEKKYFKQKSIEAKAIHKKLYPNWRYQPLFKKKKNQDLNNSTHIFKKTKIFKKKINNEKLVVTNYGTDFDNFAYNI